MRQHLAHTVGIGLHVHVIVKRRIELERQAAFARMVPQHADHAAGEFRRIETPRLQLQRQGLHFRQVDHVVEQAAQQLAGFIHRAGNLRLGLVQRRVREIHCHAAQAFQRHADFIVHQVEKGLFGAHCGRRAGFRLLGIVALLFGHGMGARHLCGEIGILEAQPEGFAITAVDALRPAGDGCEEHGRQRHRGDRKWFAAPQQHAHRRQAGGRDVTDDGRRVVGARDRGRHGKTGKDQQVENFVCEGRAGQPQQGTRAPCRAADDGDQRIAPRPECGVSDGIRVGAEAGAHPVEENLGDKLDGCDDADRPEGRLRPEGEPDNGDGTENRQPAGLAEAQQQTDLLGIDPRVNRIGPAKGTGRLGRH